MKKVINIEGMSCMHCVAHARTALEEIPGVSSAVVDLKEKKAVIEASDAVTDEMIRNAIDEVGYSVTNIE